MIDRSKRPQFKLITDISLPAINRLTLRHDVPLIYINDKREEIIRLLINFKAGSWHQKKRLVASTTFKMLDEGTKSKNSEQIAQIFNYYGAEFKTRRFVHNSYLQLTLLTKFLEPVLELTQEIITQPTFPQQELEILLNNEKQEYLVDLENVSTVARNLFYAAIYGFDHPYGTYALPEDFDKVTRQDLIDFHKKHLHRNNLSIYSAGAIDEKHLKIIDKYLTDIPEADAEPEPQYRISPAEQKFIYKPKDGSLQSAINLGQRAVGINHPDYPFLHFVVFLLGGYFGSRLMTNIREEKGLTYGIYAALEAHRSDGVINIEAEVRKENYQQVLDEIRKEIQKLKTHGATEEEILTVKNYLSARILTMIDGTFSVLQYINFLHANGLDQSFLFDYLQKIKQIDNEKIIQIAQKYLCYDQFYKVVVG